MSPLLFGRRTIQTLATTGSPDTSGGRSLWQDARGRFVRNRAAMVSLAILCVLVVFVLFGDFLAAWSNEEIDWAMLGKVAEEGGPSFANGHYFGVDELGRDLYARTVQGTGISLTVGVLGALVSMVVGTLYALRFISRDFTKLAACRYEDLVSLWPVVC